MLRARSNRRPVAVAVGAVLAASTAILIAPADPALAVGTPHLKVTGVGHHSFTVAVSGTSGRFKLYAAQTIKGVAVANFGTAESSSWTHSHHVTITGLKYSIHPYYYRLIAESGGHHAYSVTEGPVGLAPSKPTNLNLTGTGVLSLNWDSGAATGYQVVQATNAGLTEHRKVYTLHGLDQQFTPYGLTPGTPYFFAVRARNRTTSSGLTPPVSGTPSASQQAVSVMTYNVREARLDGQSEGGGTVAPWAQRKVPAAELIKSAHPDFVMLEEAASFAPTSPTRQVDDLRDQLNSDGVKYDLAVTEIPPPQKHYHRTGVYILYNPDNYRPVGRGDHWALGESRWAVYQAFGKVGSNSKVLMVAFHLLVGVHPGYDAKRQAEVESMLQQAHSYNSSHGNLPIIYGGDTNSQAFVHKNGSTRHEFDGARAAFRAEGIDGASDAAQSRTHAKFNSGNGYKRRPPRNGIYLDDLFAPPGVAVSSWKMLLKLRHGKFVGTIPSDHNPIVATMHYPA
ncbi:MAG TPA: endonuclease/exonuclease/phosphatase family protein [Mycobacteriales bacterium]|jgi:hypothetical protein|nr:endonuclease/exonuclease/phosphatase family protein [Mycobacteriales bacterium]HVX70102.1 endonuclease/exonuclease/phosphatase family protein [Mycobacteriales bacterium]